MRTGMSILAAAAALSACEAPAKPAEAAPAPSGDIVMAWRAEDGGAAYGTPGMPTLWAACDGGRLAVGGFAAEDGEDGRPTTVVLGGRTYPAVLGEGAHGEITFAATVDLDDPAVATLLAGRALDVVQGGQRRTIPADGAAAVLRPVVEACRG